MFQLSNPTVHYGTSSYPLNGLPERLNTISGIEDLDAADLMQVVGRLTSFAREFKISYHPRLEVPIEGRDPIVIPERICALANGYTLTWNKVN
jgi:hypothetical protein